MRRNERLVRRRRAHRACVGLAVAVAIAASCSPGDGPESIPLPTSSETTTTTTLPATTTTLVPPRYEATIRRTTDGVPHVSGATADDVAYGQGRANAEDDSCTLLDQVLKVLGQRSAALGPGATGENVESDFGWLAIDIASVAAADFDDVASDLVTERFEAYTAGWNDHLAEVGSDGLTGWCAGADWVRPLRPVEIYTYARSIALDASSAALVPFIAGAQPPAAGTNGIRARSEDPAGVARSSVADSVAAFEAAARELGLADGDGGGSNGWAIGRDRVAGGTGGLLFANPHVAWDGERRFSEVHLTVPGGFDVYGANRVGLPGVGIGFTDGLAWTHTTSAGKRMTAYELALQPGLATSYVVDGLPVAMIATPTTVEIRRADGSVDTETRTMWRSEYGPILNFPGVGWTGERVLTYRDANIDNEEFVEQYARLPEAGSIDELVALDREHQGVPLFNTVAADRSGDVWYADTSATPNLSAEGELLFVGRLFADPLTAAAYEQGIVLLDGSDSRLRWEDQPGARDSGLIPFGEMPQVQRSDYVFNANDSFWAPSAEFTLTGPYSLLHGEQFSPLSMRTRQNAAVLDAANPTGLAGPDGVFDAAEVRTAAFDNSALTAALLLPAAVAACQAFPIVEVEVEVDESFGPDGSVVLPAGPVDVSGACGVLATWDGRYDLDRAGPMVWREMMGRFQSSDVRGAGPLFSDAFDPSLPTTSPSVPAIDQTPMLQAMARAVQTITAAGFDVETALGAAQFSERGASRIALHGGRSDEGVTNVVSWTQQSTSGEPPATRGEPVTPGSTLRGEGYRVNSGTSFVMTVDLTGETPSAWALLVSGQTVDPDSALSDAQAQAFGDKTWREVAFTDEQIEADPALTTSTVVGR